MEQWVHPDSDVPPPRLLIHESIYDVLKQKLINAYQQLRIGDPLDPTNHVGPLIDKDAVVNYLAALDQISKQGGSF